jgi:DNA gyrase subunit A
VDEGDDVFAIRASGSVTRSPVRDVPAKGRDTMGVKYVSLGSGDAVVAIARNAEQDEENEAPSAEGGTE